jgi:ABC-type sugar transport system ATPase subunit
MVEIAKALSIKAKILIMDEPTSSLTNKETEILFKLIKNLKGQGVSIIYISHKLEEIYDICDQVTVIRDGKWIEDFPISEATNNRIIKLMVGRPIDMVFPQKLISENKASKQPVIKVENLHKHGLVSDINFSVAPGEILGISGLVGAGRTEMAKTLFGAIKKDEGHIYLDGKEITINSPHDSIRQGIAMITEDRKLEGLFLGLSVKDNIMASNLEIVLKSLCFIDRTKEKELAENAVEKLNVKTSSLDCTVSGLSGGNQQKMIISRWLAKHVKVLIMDEPTRGIDVGAKKAIYDIMRKLSREGIAIIMISSELPEILGMSDRIAVMRSGRIVKIISREEASQTLVMQYAVEGGNQ